MRAAVIRSGLALFLAGACALAAPPQGAYVEWQPATLRLVARQGVYARIIRLQSGELLCCYQKNQQCRITRSGDDGATWGQEQEVTSYQHGTAANPELIQLRNGDVLLLYNERPEERGHPFAIMSMVSHSEGKEWEAPRRIFEGGHEFRNGCWEPSALQFADGEVQIYFANETPYPDSDEQEISMISLNDPATVRTVSFRSGARDGMPVPCLLKDGQTAVLAIEDSGLKGRMKPVILYSDAGTRWKSGPIGGQSRCRRPALKEPLPGEVYAGAPYLCQMASGITLLSVQSDEGRPAAQMAVYVGDEKAQNFTRKSIPFPAETGTPGQWNSLFVKNSNTVTAVSGTRLNGVSGIWIIDGIVRGAERARPFNKEQ